MRRKSSRTPSTASTLPCSNDKDDVFVFQNEIPSGKTLDLLPAGSESEPYSYALYPPVTITTNSHRHFRSSIREFWAETWLDFTTFRWRQFSRRFALHLFALGCIATLAWFIFALSTPRRQSSLCSPNGDFHLDGSGIAEWYNPWSGSGIFAIDIQFGRMDFSTAKGVDILWDLGFGRGMQGLLTVISYKVCTKSLSRLMEKTPVPLRSFEAITLQSDTFIALSKLARDALNHNNLRARMIVLWIVASTVILLAFQSLASAMTGYVASIAPFIQTETGDRVPATQFQAVQYIIHDGHRLNGTFYDDYPVLLPYWNLNPTTQAYAVYGGYPSTGSGSNMQISGDCIGLTPWKPYEKELNWKPIPSSMTAATAANCLLLWHLSEYTATYGFLGLNATTSTLNNSGTIIELPSPALNISAYFGLTSVPRGVPWSQITYGYWWSTPDGRYPFNNSNPMWAYGKNQYNVTSINKRGTCQQQDLGNVQYRWGFSSFLLLVFCWVMFVWILGTYSMYWDAYMNSRLHVSERDIGLKRAVLDVHTAMQMDLDGLNTDQLGNSQLKKKVKNNRLDYTELLTDETHTNKQQFRQWRRNFRFWKWVWDEKWWWLVFAVLSTIVYLSLATSMRGWWFTPLTSVPLLSTIIVLFIGRGHKSRWFTFLLLFQLFLIPNVVIMVWFRKKRYYYWYVW